MLGRVGLSKCFSLLQGAEFVHIMGKDDNKVLFCKADSQYYMECLYFLPPEEVCQRYHADDEFRAKADAGKAARADPSKRDFPLESVDHHVTFEMEVEKKFTILDDGDWQRAFNAPPKAASTRYNPSVTLPNESGDMTKFYLFQYDCTSAFRSLTLRRKASNDKQRCLLSAHNHVYHELSDEVQEWDRKALDAEIMSALTNKRLPALEVKVRKKTGAAETAGGGASLSFGPFSDGEFAGEDAATAGSPSGALPLIRAPSFASASSGGVVGSIPVVASVAAGGFVGGGAGFTKACGSSPRMKVEDGKVAAVVQSSARSAWGGPCPKDDNASVAGGRPAKISVSANAEGPLDLAGWVEKLDLSEAMQGKFNKLSVHHANQAVNRWSNMEGKKGDAKKLKEHLALYNVADSVNPNRMRDLEKGELRGALEALSSKTTITLDVWVALCCRELAEMRTKMHDEPSVAQFLEVGWPFGDADDKSAFDPERPKVSALACPIDRKIEMFSDLVMQEHVSSLIDGYDKRDKAIVQWVTRGLRKLADKVIEAETDQSELESGLLCDLQTFCLSMEALLCPSEVLTHPECSRMLQCLTELWSEARPSSCLDVVRSTIKDNSDLNDSNRVLETKKPGLLEFRGPAGKAVRKFKELDMKVVAPHVQVLEETLAWLPRCVATLGTVLSSVMSVLVEEHLEAVVKHILLTASANQSSVEDLDMSLKMMNTAISVFPTNTKLADWKQEASAQQARLSKVDLLSKFTASVEKAALSNVVGDGIDELEHAFEQIASLGPPPESLPHCKTVGAILIDECVTQYPDKIREGHLKFAEKLLKAIDDCYHPTNKNLLKPMLDCFSLLGSQEKLVASASDDDGAFHPTKVNAADDMVDQFLNKLVRAKTATAELSDDDTAALAGRGVCEQILRAADEVRKEIGEFDSKEKFAAWDTTHTDVDLWKGGDPSGGDWLLNLPGGGSADFPDFLAHAKATLLMNPMVAELDQKVRTMEQATKKTTEKYAFRVHVSLRSTIGDDAMSHLSTR